jgi:hypothetical protein
VVGFGGRLKDDDDDDDDDDDVLFWRETAS